MKVPFTNRWSSWVEEHRGSAYALLVRTLEKQLIPGLKEEGFEVPSRRGLESALRAGLPDLPVETRQGVEVKMCSLVHFLNLLWQPVLCYIQGLVDGGSPSWTPTLAKNHEALILEMDGTVQSPEETMPTDAWFEFIKDTIFRLVGIEVPLRLLVQILTPLVPLTLETTPANAMHVLRSSICSKLVGSTLAAQVNRMILAEIAELPVPLLTDQEMISGMKRDLAGSLEQQHCKPDAEENIVGHQPAKKARRDQQSIDELMGVKTKQVLWTLQNRLCVKRSWSTLTSAKDLIDELTERDQDPRAPDVGDLMLSSHDHLMRHILLLDGAMDRATSETIFGQRENGTFAGVAFATDESPPKQPRFRGLRFQITVMYRGTFVPLANWESCASPPISSTSVLADIMHCPGKKGDDVSRILEKQLARVGLNCYDAVAGTGDGGGENEGSSGVHQHFENLSPGYVRRRCLPHLAWRTADMAIRAAGGLDYKSLAAYLVDGITWTRLREIGVRSRLDGGLGLFTDGSRACKEIFGKSPSAIISSRPDTDLHFLRLLQGKEHVLHKLATKDLEQRTSLGAETTRAVANLGDVQQRIRRAVLSEILERCMFLLHWNVRHNMVAAETSWEQLVAQATSLILDLGFGLSANVHERFKTTPETLAAMDPPPRTWVELAVLQVVGEPGLVAERLQDALDFHRAVADQAAAHLALVGDNTFRTPWMAAKLLSRDKNLARAAAKELAKHLATTRPGNRTTFEAHVFGTAELWRNLEAFSEADPPVLLWHGHGRYETLFKFLAPRFLLAPDHVLDAERVHARWQWACQSKRSLKVQTLNACLRLTHYLENNQNFPSNEDLLPHLHAERIQHNVNLEAIVAEGEVAFGWRREFLYRERLGLSAADVRLLVAVAAPAAAVAAGGQFAVAWRNYVKAVFKRGFVYTISCSPSAFLYISENKTLAGKEDRTSEGEAAGRKLAVTFFEQVPGRAGVVHRVEQEGLTLRPRLLTIAEMLQTCGFALPPDLERTAATTELLLEAQYQNLEIRRFVCTVDTEAPQVHTYILTDESNAEETWAMDLPPEHRTKMVLVRCLQRNEALDDEETLEKAWGSTLAALQARAAPHLPAPPAAAAAAPPPGPPALHAGPPGHPAAARGRGRGRGRGRAAPLAPPAPPPGGRGRGRGRG